MADIFQGNKMVLTIIVRHIDRLSITGKGVVAEGSEEQMRK